MAVCPKLGRLCRALEAMGWVRLILPCPLSVSTLLWGSPLGDRSHISRAPLQLCVPTHIRSDPRDVAEATYTIPVMDSNGLPTVVGIPSLSGSAVWRGNQGGC